MGRLEHTSAHSAASIMPLPLQVALGLWMAGVTAATFFYVPPAAGFASPEAARIIIFHVPCAMLAVAAYVVSTCYAIGYLHGRNLTSDGKSSISAGLGFLFTVLATATGMVFAHIQWGTAWNWDPRETSILVLMLVYAAYFALRSAVPGAAVRARICAVYNILACVIMPYLVFVMPRLTASLHPSTTLTTRGSLGPEYRLVLVCSMIGYLWLYLWVFRMRTRVHEIEQRRKSA